VVRNTIGEKKAEIVLGLLLRRKQTVSKREVIATRKVRLPRDRDRSSSTQGHVMTVQVFRPLGRDLVTFVEETAVVAESL